MADELPEFVCIPAGPFDMGSEDADPNEGPVHTVQLKAFAIGAQPVTNGEYARFVRETGHRPPDIHELPLVVTTGGADRERAFRSAAAPYIWATPQPKDDRRDHPVTLVRWDDAATYCRWLSTTLGRTVRLPTEAEWEKAARGGLDRQRYPWGDALDPARANYLADPAVKATHGTSPVRSYPPNGYGLFDMAGNVWEWVNDWYDVSYYAVSPDTNPAGPDAGRFRMVRGGGWLAPEPAMLTCSHRHQVPADTYSYGIGFRVACDPVIAM